MYAICSLAYWEPAKWVAKLREYRTNSPEVPLLLKTDMSTGHFSASDRYKYIRETAVEYSFILEQICPSVVSAALETSTPRSAPLAEET
jgi:protease II